MIHKLISVMHRLCLRILLSTTLRKNDVDKCKQLLGDMKPNVVYGTLDCRGILFWLHISGNLANSLMHTVREHFVTSPDVQQILYTHSRENTEGPMQKMVDNLLEENQKKNGGPVLSSNC